MNELEASVFLACIAEPNDQTLGICTEFFGVVETALAIMERTQPGTTSLRSGALEEFLMTRSPDATSGLSARRLSNGLMRWSNRARTVDVSEVIRRSEKVGATILNRTSSLWPVQLSSLGYGQPHCLWLRGNAELACESGQGISVVGSRSASPYGEYATTMVAETAVGDDRVVVSGGAFGIDALAHRSALRGRGNTVAVFAGGIDRLYPSGNTQLLKAIPDNDGALISEVPPGALPMKSRFLARNRIIAALTTATVVVEAAWRSGSLSTAHHALEIGRFVGAVPGPITSAQSAGCHRLMNEAQVVTVASPQDVRALYSQLDQVGASDDLSIVPGQGSGGGAYASNRQVAASRSAEQVQVLDALNSRRPASLDEIVLAAGMGVAQVIGLLGQLEREGVVSKDLFGWSLGMTRL